MMALIIIEISADFSLDGHFVLKPCTALKWRGRLHGSHHDAAVHQAGRKRRGSALNIVFGH